MLNERLGKYLLLEKLKSTGPDKFFLAKSSVADGLNKFFVIKKTFRTSTAKIEIPSLSHNNILAVFDSGIDRGFFFTVMDYFESYSLAQIQNDFRAAHCSLGIDQSLYIVRETAAALIYAHNYTAHGKIRTESILIGLDGSVKVSDFEILKEAKSEANSDLRTLGHLLSSLLGENRRASKELEDLMIKSLSEQESHGFSSAGDFYREINRYLNTNYPEYSSPEFGEQLIKFYGVAVQEQRLRLREYARIDVLKAVQLLVPDIYESSEKSVARGQTQLTSTSLPEGFTSIPDKDVSPAVNFENIDRENPFVLEPAPAPRPPPRAVQKPLPIMIPEEAKSSVLSDLILISMVGGIVVLICYAYKITIRGYSKNMIESVKSGQAELPAWSADSAKGNLSGDVLTRMQASRKLAYVNIRIIGANAATRIFVDGKELIEKAPVKMYPIFAGRETIVSAIDPKSNRFDEKKINLKAGAVTSLVLTLRVAKN